MILRSMYLQHFRSYTEAKFDFSDTFTAVIGPNTAGKTNLSEAISLLLTGKSFRTTTDMHMIQFGKGVGRVGGVVGSRFTVHSLEKETMNDEPTNSEQTKLEVVIASPVATAGRFSKKFLVNGVAKSRINLRGFLPLILFRPEELDIIIDGPSLRRNFLNEVLEQTDKEYYYALATYEKSLRQRNALLRFTQEVGKRNEEQFSYWDQLLITNGQILTQKREALLDFLNANSHEILPLEIFYDKSTISQDRLLQYKQAEVGAGVTLVGPHRDDFVVEMKNIRESSFTPEVRNESLESPNTSGVLDIRNFGSRGQQRLAVLQLKMLQIEFIQQQLHVLPLLVLDDIFSELDTGHIQLVLEKVGKCQVILTTTHKEFIPQEKQKEFTIIELEK